MDEKPLAPGTFDALTEGLPPALEQEAVEKATGLADMDTWQKFT
jgi:hypothetical protein